MILLGALGRFLEDVGSSSVSFRKALEADSVEILGDSGLLGSSFRVLWGSLGPLWEVLGAPWRSLEILRGWFGSPMGVRGGLARFPGEPQGDSRRCMRSMKLLNSVGNIAKN